MKRQRAFLDQGDSAIVPTKKRALAVSIQPPLPPLNATQKRQVQRIIKNNLERKYFLSGFPAASVSNTMTLTSCQNIAQSDDNDGRIGNEVRLVQVKLRLDCTLVDSTNIVRVILFKWRENDQFNAPTAAQLFGLGPSGGIDANSFPNDEHSQTFMILWDKTFIGSGGSSADTLRQFATKTIPLAGKSQYYSGATVTGTNKIYIAYISDSSAVSHPSLTWWCEVAYTDS